METHPKLEVRESNVGRSVYATGVFVFGEKILDFVGPVLDYDEIVDGSYISEHCFQIGPRTYLGPSGDLDDIFNHSCDPTAGLKEVGENKFALFAIRNIKVGEEVTWDYSTYIEEPGYLMDCVCGVKNCRQRIGSFSLLPKDTQQKYIDLGAVAPFIRNLYKK